MKGEICNANVVFVGDICVGKSCIMRRMAGDTLDELPTATIHCHSVDIEHPVNGGMVKLSLMDCPGYEKFRTLVPLYLRNAAVIVLVFSQNAPNSLENIDDWMQLVREASETENVSLFLVENAADCDNHLYTQQQIEAVANKYSMQFRSVSAIANSNIGDLIADIADAAYEKLKNPKDLPQHPISIEQNEQQPKNNCFLF